MSSITIKDVARKAGVSTATVSRVMNKNGKIRAETAERVQEAVRVLGFRPSAMGRGLKTARTRTLGVLLPSLSNPVFADAAEGIQESAQAAGYSVFITCNNYDPAAEERAVDTMLEQRVEAMILTVADAEQNEQLNRLEQEQVPHVLMFNPATPKARNVITVDNEEAGRLVAEEFIQLGHQRLGMIAGRFIASDRSRARYLGFCEGAEAAGVGKPELIEVDFVDGRIARTIASLYASPNPPTALFCSTDLLAMAVISALRNLGFQVPHDVSVIGFDGISFGKLFHPTLASVVQPSRAMGRAAVQHLLGQFANAGAARNQVLPTRFRAGLSAGPAPKHESKTVSN